MKKTKAEVILADTRPGIAGAIREVFKHFGGGANIVPLT